MNTNAFKVKCMEKDVGARHPFSIQESVQKIVLYN